MVGIHQSNIQLSILVDSIFEKRIDDVFVLDCISPQTEVFGYLDRFLLLISVHVSVAISFASNGFEAVEEDFNKRPLEKLVATQQNRNRTRSGYSH